MTTHRSTEPLARRAARPALAALAVAALAAALAGGATPAAGQGWIEMPDPRPDRPAVRPVVKVRTDVRVRIVDRVAEVEVEEWFENRGRVVAEGVYHYPLPGEAVFSNFSLYQDDQELRGETMDADRARAIYEEIVRNLRDPALIELVGHGLIRARVFPIEPGQRRKVTLRYTQLMDRAGDALRFRYLAAGAGRDPGAPPPAGFLLTADAATFDRPFSPTHDLRVDRQGAELRVRPAGDIHGDLTLFLPLARPLVGLTLATHRPAAEPGYFMLTLSPGTVRADRMPRDIVAVVDVSGSMAGEKMEQTRQALHQLLGSLGPRDRFRLISFSSRVATSRDGWSDTSPDEMREARRWVDGLRAQGATNIQGALEEAFRLASPADRLPIVVFLTDGLPTVGERDPERIAAMAEARRGRARVFAFGVGYDVNTVLLDRLSAAARGSTAYVQPAEDVERAVGTLAMKITHPVLTDLELLRTPVRLTEIHPVTLPDLFAGEELVLFGRYDGAGSGELRLRGRRGDRTETFGIAASFPARATDNEFIPRLWAARKLGELTRLARQNGPDPELVEEIRATALRYGLLSEYTAHLVQEPTVVAGQPRPLPAAPMAMSATGAEAVRSAETARLRREAASGAALDRAELALQETVAARATGFAGAGRAARRVVAGRVFEEQDDVWVQAAPRDGVTEIAVRAYSPAWFALLDALPELRPVARELERAVVVGGRVAFRFGDEGRETLSPAETARLATEFRAR